MRCREVRKKINKFAGDQTILEEEKAFLDHLSRCPDCARLALSERLLAADIEQLRQTHLSTAMNPAQVRAGIAVREQRFRNMNMGARIMQRANASIHKRPRLSLAAAAVIILLSASVLTPVGSGKSTEYEVAFAPPDSGVSLNQQNAEKLLAALELSKAHVELLEDDSGIKYKITPLQDSAQVQKLMAVLNSLGGQRIRSETTKEASKNRTIWQLLFDDSRPKTKSQLPGDRTQDDGLIINLNDEFEGDFTLWMPIDGQVTDSLSGLLLDRQGERTNMQFVGLPADKMIDDCGWNKSLHGNTVMNMRLSDGNQVSFDLTKIEDVRKLEKMGYNFATTKWDEPRQVPIPGMGPKLNEIKPNPFAEAATIKYMVPQASEVQVQIFDKKGDYICTLVNCIKLAGAYDVIWDGRDADGNPVKPGSYFCRFTAGDYKEAKEVVLNR